MIFCFLVYIMVELVFYLYRMQSSSLFSSQKIHCLYNSIDEASNGIGEWYGWKQNKSLGVVAENDAKVSHILEDSEQDSIPVLDFSDVTLDAIRQTRDVPLLLKIKTDTYISVVSTSVLEDGSEVFTIRYGITTKSRFPEFSWLSLLIRDKNGTFLKQEVITQSDSKGEFENYGEQLITHLGWFHQDVFTFSKESRLQLDNNLKLNGNCDIYNVGYNYKLNPVYILNISNIWDPNIWLQCELWKFYNGEPAAYKGMNSIYLGSMIKWADISIWESLLRVISEQKSLEIEDDWMVYFFRDDTHSKESKVRTVAQYKKLFPSH